jgi:quercetin dioxygenase-like cupin family protein
MSYIRARNETLCQSQNIELGVREIMNTTIASSNNSFTATLQDLIKYPTSGISSKVLLKDNNSQYNLLCLASGTKIDEHTSTRNAVITVVEGTGSLNLSGKDIALAPGVFVFMPANAPHAVQARENLTFILALSEHSSSIKATSHAPQTICDKFNVQNPAHLVYLSIGDCFE